jgi:hypothetical protein
MGNGVRFRDGSTATSGGEQPGRFPKKWFDFFDRDLLQAADLERLHCFLSRAIL